MSIKNYSPSVGIQVTELNMKYYDRGKTGTDFEVGDLTLDNTNQDLDLSAIVSPAAANHLVHIGVVEQNAAAGQRLYFFQKGTEVTKNGFGLVTQVGGIQIYESGWVMLDENRVITYVGFPGAWALVNIVVRGWMTD